MDEAEDKKSDGSEKISRVEKVERELNSFKRDVEMISKNLAKSVEDLRNAVLEIRAAVSEIENPFNLLRVITNEKDLERLQNVKSMVEEKIQRSEEKTDIERHEAYDEVREIELSPLDSKKAAASRLPMNFGTSIIRWIYTMLDMGLDGEGIQKLVEYCEAFGFLPQGSSLYISNIIDVVIGARSKGLSEEEIILSLYSAAEAAGIKLSSHEISSLLIQILRRSRLIGKMVG